MKMISEYQGTKYEIAAETTIEQNMIEWTKKEISIDKMDRRIKMQYKDIWYYITIGKGGGNFV